MIDYTELLNSIRQFRDERDWLQYHTPPNLAQSISIEAAELLELFQWGKVPSTHDISEELADVLIYCLNLADILALDVTDIIQRKMAKNAIKYPAQHHEPATE